MTKEIGSIPGAMTLAEMKEFASFGSATQRYIRRSLDVGLDRADAVELEMHPRVRLEEMNGSWNDSLYYAIREGSHRTAYLRRS